MNIYRTLILLPLLFAMINGFSQDLIVTNSNDSINCKITKIRSDLIYFTFRHNNEYRSTLLPVSDIKTHQIDYFSNSEVPIDKVIGLELNKHFRLAVNGGFSYMTAKIGDVVLPDLRDYIKDLKSGYHLGGDMLFYFSKTYGAGIKYNVMKSSNSIDNIYLQDNNGNRRYGKMSDNIRTTFIGPVLSTRLDHLVKNNSFYINYTMGYLRYSNRGALVNYQFEMTGNTLGLALDIGYDIGLSDNLSLGFQGSLMTGKLSTYWLDDGSSKEKYELEEDGYIGLGRIEFSVGLRFIK